MTDSPNDAGRDNPGQSYQSPPVRIKDPLSPKQVRNRLLLIIATVIARCIAASEDLISLFGF